MNGSEAVCRDLNCDFTYVEPLGEVTSFTFDEASKLLVVTGTRLPATSDLLRHIVFAHEKCDISGEDAFAVDGETISITCTLGGEPTVGMYHPIVVATIGTVPMADGVAAL